MGAPGRFNMRYRSGKGEAKQRLDAAGYARTEHKGGGDTWTVEGRIWWNAKTGQWRANDGTGEGEGVGSMMHFMRQHKITPSLTAAALSKSNQERK